MRDDEWEQNEKLERYIAVTSVMVFRNLDISSFVNVKGYLQFAEFSSLEYERFRQFEIWWTCGIFVERIHENQIIEISNAILKPSSLLVNSWTDAGIQLENGECLCEATCLAISFVLRKLPVFLLQRSSKTMLSRSSSKLLRKELLERSRGASYFSKISQVVRLWDPTFCNGFLSLEM